MVHYDPALDASPQPPTLCPKCGSHRTEIVGTNDDGAILIIRCNACGARSEVSNDTRRTALAVEADAMARIARVLADLDDIAARERVLRWAIDRTSGAAPAATAADAVEADECDDLLEPAPLSAADPNLGVDGVADLFDAPARGGEALAVGGFVVGGDFRRRVRGGWIRT